MFYPAPVFFNSVSFISLAALFLPCLVTMVLDNMKGSNLSFGTLLVLIAPQMVST